MLTAKEQEKYFKVLSKYKDVFTWSYKEIPRLDPMVRVHNLPI